MAEPVRSIPARNNVLIESDWREAKIMRFENRNTLLFSQSSLLFELSDELINHIQNGTHISFKPFLSELEVLRQLDYHPRLARRFKTDLQSISLNLINNCNMKCGYCSVGPAGSYNNRSTSKMTPFIAKNAIDYLVRNSSASVLGIIFFGGEPIINWKTIYETLKYTSEIKDRTWLYTIVTNATLITEKIAQVLAEHNVRLIVSFDGPPEVQNSQRPLKNGENSYKTVLDSINILKKYNVPMTLTGVYTKGSLVTRGTIEAHLREIAGQYANVTVKHEERSLTFDDEFAKDFYQKQIDLAIDEKEKLLNNGEIELKGNFIDVLWKLIMGSNGNESSCYAGRESIHISPVGEIYVCHQAESADLFKLGNVFNNYDDKTAEIAKKFHEPSRSKCHDCWAYELCGGECPLYHAYFDMKGDRRDPNPAFCNMTMTIIEHAAEAAMNMNEKNMKILARRCEKDVQDALLNAFKLRAILWGDMKHIKPIFLFPLSGQTELRHAVA